MPNTSRVQRSALPMTLPEAAFVVVSFALVAALSLVAVVVSDQNDFDTVVPSQGETAAQVEDHRSQP